MKKLKKIVALVMTVAMLAGLFVFAGPGANAAQPYRPYDDDDDITAAYRQAIQLFTNMRVITGVSGSLYPNSDLTRAEAATIITRAHISRDAADSLGNNSNPFNDVQAGHWASGPIAYARNRGLISGIGNGMFNPNGRLTKAAWLRMLLSSIGYGDNGEFTGSGWAARVFETATNPQVDLFGRYNTDAGAIFGSALTGANSSIELNRIRIPENEFDLAVEGVERIGLNDYITREEAVALMYNTVLFTRKVVYDRAANIYTPEDASAGFSGSDFSFFRDDIALIPWPNENRDNYGRPHDWTIEWAYRNEWIYSQPATNTPTLLVSYKGSQTGNQIRQALQGIIGNLSDLTLTNSIRLFTNGYFNETRAWNAAGTDSSLGTATTTAFPVAYTAVQALESFLTGKGNSVAFGPAVTIEVYEHRAGLSQNKGIDIVIIMPYLTQLTRKVADNPATILLDETGLQFNVFDTATGTPMNESERYGSPSHAGLSNFRDLYDNAATGSYHLTTPYFMLSPVATVTSVFTTGGLRPIVPTLPMGPNLTAIENRNTRNLNEVFPAARTITGVAGAASLVTVTIGGTSYNRALISPTVIQGDFTNNYVYYLDSDDIIIGADYTAPGQASMGGYLYLRDALGTIASGSSHAAWARADVTLGTGRRDVVDLLRNGNSVWLPSGSYYDMTAVGAAYDENGYPLVTIPDGFYAYTVVNGQYRLSNLTAGVEPLNIAGGGIERGAPVVGTSSSAPTQVSASSRTILTVVDGGGGARTFTGFSSFPTPPLTAASGTSLVRLEPGTGNSRIAAEILYIFNDEADIGPPTYYAYLTSTPVNTDSYGQFWAEFVCDDGVTRSLKVNYELDVTETRFYKLTDASQTGDWTAASLTSIGSEIAFGWSSRQPGFNSTPYAFPLGPNKGGLGTPTWYGFNVTGMNLIGVPVGVEQSTEMLGKNTDIDSINEHRVIVALLETAPLGGYEAKVAFVFGIDIGQNEIAGLPKT